MRSDWKQIRVFISSTFLDMQAERDHLVRFVFPRLRAQLLPKHIHLVDVDLRWGVTDGEDASEVCREVIGQCRPRFLCILGGRYGSTPTGGTRSITHDEVNFAVLERPIDERRFSYFYFRDEAVTESMVEHAPGEFREPRGSENAGNLEQLKENIVRAGLRPFGYRPQWDSSTGRLIHLEEFGERVEADLLESLRLDPDVQARFGPGTPQFLDEFEEEEAAHDAFVGERIGRYVPGSRERVTKELLGHALANDSQNYVFVTGPMGIGKMSLLTNFSRQHPRLLGGATLISHFVGASPGSSDPQLTIRRLVRELRANQSGVSEDIPTDGEELRAAFRESLSCACATGRVVIILGGIDQLQQEAGSPVLRWLPERPPENARFILSATAQSSGLEPLRRVLRAREIELEPLSVDDREAIVERFHRLYGKGLERSQRDALLHKADAGSPLYLWTALEELRTLGPREEMSARIAELPEETSGLFAWILERLEDDDGFRDASGTKVGRELVPRFASLLAASRQGLDEEDLSALVAPKDPMGNVAALMRLLREHLTWRGDLVSFGHSAFREAVRSRFAERQQGANRDLAARFRRLADPEENDEWGGTAWRALSELPYHLNEAGLHDGLIGVLTSQRYAQRLVWMRSREVLLDNLQIGFTAAQLKCSLPFGARLLAAWGRAQSVRDSAVRFNELADEGRIAEAVRAAGSLPLVDKARLVVAGANRALDRGWRTDFEGWLKAMAPNSNLVACCVMREHLRLVDRFLAAEEPSVLESLLVGASRDSAQRFLCFLIGTRQLSASSFPCLVEAAKKIPDPLWRGFTMMVICIRGLRQGMPTTEAARHLRDAAASIRGSGRDALLVEAISRAYRWLNEAGIEIADLGVSPADVTGTIGRFGVDSADQGHPVDHSPSETGLFEFLPDDELLPATSAEGALWTVLRSSAQLLEGVDGYEWRRFHERVRRLLAEQFEEHELMPRRFLRLPADARIVVAVSLVRIGELNLLASTLDELCSENGSGQVLPEVFRLIKECWGQPGVGEWLTHALATLGREANLPGREIDGPHNDPFADAAAVAAGLLASLERVEDARQWMHWLLARLDPPMDRIRLGGGAGRSARVNAILGDTFAALPSPYPVDASGPTASEAARLAIAVNGRLAEALCEEFQVPSPPLDYLAARIIAWKAEDQAWRASPADAFELFYRCIRPGPVYDDYEIRRSWFTWLLCFASDPSERELTACHGRLIPLTRPVFPHELVVSQALWNVAKRAADDRGMARATSALVDRFRELDDHTMTARLASAGLSQREPGEQAELLALAAEGAARQGRSTAAQVYVSAADAVSPGYGHEAGRRVELVQAAREAEITILANSAGKEGFDDAVGEAVRVRVELGDRVGLLCLSRLLNDCPVLWRDLLAATCALMRGSAGGAALADILMSESGLVLEGRGSER